MYQKLLSSNSIFLQGSERERKNSRSSYNLRERKGQTSNCCWFDAHSCEVEVEFSADRLTLRKWSAVLFLVSKFDNWTEKSEEIKDEIMKE